MPGTVDALERTIFLDSMGVSLDNFEKPWIRMRTERLMRLGIDRKNDVIGSNACAKAF
jgi:hypothetical protein